MKYILGVDPGLSGAMALIDPVLNIVIDHLKMPKIKRGTRSDLDLSEIAIWLSQHASSIRSAIVEDVSAMPKQGVTSMFTFGRVTGIAVGMIGAHHIPIQFVPSAVWKNVLGLNRDKKKSIDLANELYFNKSYSTKLTNDGIAEAILIAHFGKRFFNVVK